MALVWTEHGGPLVVDPGQTGFGSKLVARMVAQLGGGVAFDWSSSGVIVKLDMKKDRLAA